MGQLPELTPSAPHSTGRQFGGRVLHSEQMIASKLPFVSRDDDVRRLRHDLDAILNHAGEFARRRGRRVAEHQLLPVDGPHTSRQT